MRPTTLLVIGPAVCRPIAVLVLPHAVWPRCSIDLALWPFVFAISWLPIMPLWHLAISSSPSGLTSHLPVDHWSCCLASLQYWFRRLVSCTTHQLVIGHAHWHIAAPSHRLASSLTSQFGSQFMLSDFMQFRFTVWLGGLASYHSFGYWPLPSVTSLPRPRRLALRPTSSRRLALHLTSQLIIIHAVWP